MKKSFAAGLIAITTFSLTFLPYPAQADTGLGGGSGFQPGAVFPFIAGVESSIRKEFFVQNLGTELAEVAFGETGVPGIELLATAPEELNIQPGQTKTIEFDLRVSSFVAPGDYPLIIVLQQTNVPEPPPGQTAYAPAISSNLVVRVSGTSANVTILPVNSFDGSPASGEISLNFLSEEGEKLEIASVRGDRLEKDVTAGLYEARFRIEGLVDRQVEFEVLDGEDKVVEIAIEGVQFVIAVAKPQSFDGDRILTAQLSAAIRNQLERLNGPVSFLVEVSRDGQLVEEIRFASLAELPLGITEQTTIYTPASGFGAGLWEFHFIFEGPGFKVEYFNDPSILVPGPPFPWWLLLLLLLGAWLMWYVWTDRLSEEQRKGVRHKLSTASKSAIRWMKSRVATFQNLLVRLQDWWLLVTRRRRERDEGSDDEQAVSKRTD